MSSKTIITSVKGRVMDGDGNLNKFGNIDGARIQDYDHTTQTVKLRIDDSNVPGFWMEINIRFDQMAEWVEKMKKEKIENEENEIENYPVKVPSIRQTCTGFNCVCWKYGINKFCADPKYNMCMICYNSKCIRSTKGHQEECNKIPKKFKL